MLCLACHRCFDCAVGIYDSNWYKKRLNNKEIEVKNALFSAVKSQVQDSLSQCCSTPSHEAMKS
jgi:hypothetical protein